MIIDKFSLVASLGALESASPNMFAALKGSGRSLTNSMNCPDSISWPAFLECGKFFTDGDLLRFLGMGTVGGSPIGGRWMVLGSGNTPTAGEAAKGGLCN